MGHTDLCYYDTFIAIKRLLPLVFNINMKCVICDCVYLETGL